MPLLQRTQGDGQQLQVGCGSWTLTKSQADIDSQTQQGDILWVFREPDIGGSAG